MAGKKIRIFLLAGLFGILCNTVSFAGSDLRYIWEENNVTWVYAGFDGTYTYMGVAEAGDYIDGTTLHKVKSIDMDCSPFLTYYAGTDSYYGICNLVNFQFWSADEHLGGWIYSRVNKSFQVSKRVYAPVSATDMPYGFFSQVQNIDKSIFSKHRLYEKSFSLSGWTEGFAKDFYGLVANITRFSDKTCFTLAANQPIVLGEGRYDWNLKAEHYAAFWTNVVYPSGLHGFARLYTNLHIKRGQTYIDDTFPTIQITRLSAMGTAPVAGSKPDLNEATEAQLIAIADIGVILAPRIIAARNASPGGKFTNWDDVDAIPLIGPVRTAALQNSFVLYSLNEAVGTALDILNPSSAIQYILPGNSIQVAFVSSDNLSAEYGSPSKLQATCNNGPNEATPNVFDTTSGLSLGAIFGGLKWGANTFSYIFSPDDLNVSAPTYRTIRLNVSDGFVSPSNSEGQGGVSGAPGYVSAPADVQFFIDGSITDIISSSPTVVDQPLGSGQKCLKLNFKGTAASQYAIFAELWGDSSVVTKQIYPRADVAYNFPLDLKYNDDPSKWGRNYKVEGLSPDGLINAQCILYGTGDTDDAITKYIFIEEIKKALNQTAADIYKINVLIYAKGRNGKIAADRWNGIIIDTTPASISFSQVPNTVSSSTILVFAGTATYSAPLSACVCQPRTSPDGTNWSWQDSWTAFTVVNATNVVVFSTAYVTGADEYYQFRFDLKAEGGDIVASEWVGPIRIDIEPPPLDVEIEQSGGIRYGRLIFSGESEQGADITISVNNNGTAVDLSPNDGYSYTYPVYQNGSAEGDHPVAFSTFSISLSQIYDKLKISGDPPATFTFNVKTKDLAGFTVSEQITTTLDKYEPSIDFTSSTNSWTAADSFNFSGSVSDDASGVISLTYDHRYTPNLYQDMYSDMELKTPVPQDVNIGGNQFSFPTSDFEDALDQGIHNFDFTITDKAGNSKRYSNINIYVDTTPPNAPSLDTGYWQQSPSVVIIRGSATDEWGQLDKCRVLNSGSLIAEYPFYQGGQFEFSIASDKFDASIENVEYALELKSVDYAGNESTTTTTYNFKKDYSFPQIVFDNASFNSGDIIVVPTGSESIISGTITDVSLDTTTVKYNLAITTVTPMYDGQEDVYKNPGVILNADLILDENNRFVVVATHTIEAYYFIRISGKDYANNLTTKNIGFLLDTTPPLLGILKDSPFVNGNEITLIIKGEMFSVFEIYSDPGFQTFITSGTIGSDGLSQVTFLAPLGQNNFYIKTIDYAGNETKNFNPVRITVTVLKPSKPTITTPKQDGTFGKQKPTIDGVSTPDAIVVIFIDGKQLDNVKADSKGKWTYTFAKSLAAGYYYLKVRAYVEDAYSDDSEVIRFLIQIDPGQLEETLKVIGPSQVREGSVAMFSVIDSISSAPVSGVTAVLFGERYVTNTMGVVGQYRSPFVPGITIKIPNQQRTIMFGSPARTPAKVTINVELKTFSTIRIGSLEIIVLPQEPTKMLLSPNNDGINDKIVFSGVVFPVKIFSLRGEKIAEIEGKDYWDGTNDDGNPVQFGVYLWESEDGTRGKIFLRR